MAILVNSHNNEFSIGKYVRMDLTTIEMLHAIFGACITIFTIHPNNVNCLLHNNIVTTYPNDNVTTCPNVVSLTKFVIVEKYGVSYI